MKTITTTIILLLFNYLNAQESTFTITKVGDKYSREQIKTAMEAADWCGYYFESSAHSIQFDDGSLVEFKSATELGALDASCVGEDYEDKKIYTIHNTGRVIVRASKLDSMKTGSYRN